VVTDFDPLRIKRSWREEVARALSVPFAVVDGRNIIPCRAASQKQEYAAHTLRRKVARLLPSYLETVPALKRHPFGASSSPEPRVRWDTLEEALRVDGSVAPVAVPAAGEEAAGKRLQTFLRDGLGRYASERNDPNAGAQSGLSPYLHFGQLSSLRVALEVLACDAAMDGKEAFLEELVTRRELADNYCWHNSHYDDAKGFPAWAAKTLEEHRSDPRDPRYSRRRLEAADTHDRLWNAAQRELTELGTMPGYLRMYWTKKILEWSGSPEEAVETAVVLNDRYQLDGRDPNGYAGIAWSMGGVHDRPWFERPVFGKVRYMSLNGCRSKFDVDAYIARVDAAAGARRGRRTP
jgi:deoxyribodipyrimidine photo-lyase